ncbi:MAG: hypothetical protein QW063_02450 [Candidatus Nanoarchaeia archaeon]
MPRKKETKATVEINEEKAEPIFEPEKPSLAEKAKRAAKILFGILIILGGLFLIWLFLPEFLEVLKGLVGVILILVGLIMVAVGWFD